jgi:hypothetical protein
VDWIRKNGPMSNSARTLGDVFRNTGKLPVTSVVHFVFYVCVKWLL